MTNRATLKHEPPSVQLQWMRERLDEVHGHAARMGIRGWVVLQAFAAWIRDWERELGRKG